MQIPKHPYPAEEARVIHCRGSDFEIGRQHGEQVGTAASRGMAHFYFSFWKRMLTQVPKPKVEKLLFQTGRFFLDPILLNKLISRVPEFAKERIAGLIATTGLSERSLMTGLVLPDLLPLLEAYSVKFRRGSSIDVAHPRVFGCSSFISPQRYFLHGRNLDFPGVSYWDRYPVIQLTERPGFLRYLGFTTSGVPICGITGVNEAQISVSLHQHYCKITNLNGTLPFVIGEEILARAKALDEAIRVISEHKVASSWAFVVTDGKTKDAFICECHPKAMGIKRLRQGAFLTHSNFFQSEECKPAEYATTSRMNWDNFYRRQRLHDLMETHGELDPKMAVQCISDHFDPYWEEEKTISRTVSQVYNTQSLVLDTQNMKAWVAEGDSPIQLRHYVEYDLGEIFSGKSGRTGVRYPACPFKNESKRLAKEAYVLSFVAAFDGNTDLARAEIGRSLEFDFVPEGALVGGVLALKQQDTDSAKSLFSQAKDWIEKKVKAQGKKDFPPEYFEVSLFLARTFDLEGKRTEAQSIYQMIANHPCIEDFHIRRIASLSRPYQAKELARILMPYSSYIPFE